MSTPESLHVEKSFLFSKLPERATEDSCGLDLFSVTAETLTPLKRFIFDTGVRIDIPNGYYGMVAGRSSLASRYGIQVLGGIIDSGYVGNIYVILCNLSESTYFVDRGDKIAQLIIQPCALPKVKQVEFLTKGFTVRGEQGFGSSGK